MVAMAMEEMVVMQDIQELLDTGRTEAMAGMDIMAAMEVMALVLVLLGVWVAMEEMVAMPTVEHLEEEERLVQRGPSLLTAKMGQMECLIAQIVIKGNCA